MKTPNFDFAGYDLLIGDTVPIHARRNRHSTVEKAAAKAFHNITRANKRLWRNPAVRRDLTWLYDTFAIAAKKFAEDQEGRERLGLPWGPNSAQDLMTQVVVSGACPLLQLPTPPAFPTPAQPPVWGKDALGRDIPVRNPYLILLEEPGDSDSIKDAKALESADPVLAEALKYEARGGIGFAEYYAVKRDQEFYSEAISWESNPFADYEDFDPATRNGLKAKVSKNPLLNEWLQAEAAVTSVNPFREKSGNLSKQMEVFNRSRGLAYLLASSAKMEVAQTQFERGELEREHKRLLAETLSDR